MNIMKLFKDKKVVIAGPCSFGTYEELDSITKKLKELNIPYYEHTELDEVM